MAQPDRTRPATSADARLYYGKAVEFLESADTALHEERWDAADLAAIHAGISASDAVLAYRGGVRSAGQDHRSAVDLLLQVLGPVATTASRHLKRLVDKKNLVEYEQRRLTQSEALELVEHARRFIRWSATQLPARS